MLLLCCSTYVALTFESLNKIQLKVKFFRSSSIPYHLIPAPALFCCPSPPRCLFSLFLPLPAPLLRSRFPYTSCPLFSHVSAFCSPILLLYSFICWPVFASSVGPLQNFKQAQSRHECAHSPMNVKKVSPCSIFTPSFAQFTRSVESESYVSIPLAMQLLHPYSYFGVNCAAGLV